MIVDFTKPVLFDASNNGYMVTLDNGWPYEVLSGDPLRASILTWMNGQGNMVSLYVPPVPLPLDPEIQLNAEIMTSLLEEAKKKPEWQERSKQLRSS